MKGGREEARERLLRRDSFMDSLSRSLVLVRGNSTVQEAGPAEEDLAWV